nr:MAG TPA: hypothetical protein [Caudoviricetes sp.]DAI54055.1 MAG TPA: hypothetical protein [Caudoviricetes sp.]
MRLSYRLTLSMPRCLSVLLQTVNRCCRFLFSSGLVR